MKEENQSFLQNEIYQERERGKITGNSAIAFRKFVWEVRGSGEAGAKGTQRVVTRGLFGRAS